MKNIPAVSIVIPVFNTEKYLRECLTSVTGQTLTNIEVICVDNGSTDGSLAILREFAASDTRVRVVVHPAGRLGDARNAGVAVASGEYMGYVDSDDFIEEQMFERLYAAARNHSADMAVCGIATYYQKDNRYADKDTGVLEGPECVQLRQKTALLRNLTAWNKIYRREFLKEHKIAFPEDIYYEDTEYLVKAYLLANRIGIVPHACYYYRKQRDNQISTLTNEHLFDIFAIYGMIDEFVENSALDATSRACINEVKIQRVLNLFPFIAQRHRRRFFSMMQSVYRTISIENRVGVISRTEYHNYEIIRGHSFPIALLRLALRRNAGRILNIALMRRAYSGLRPPEEMKTTLCT